MEVSGAAKRGTPKLQEKMNYNSIVLELHEVLELGCLATNLFGVGVQLQSHTKQALNIINFADMTMREKDEVS